MKRAIVLVILLAAMLVAQTDKRRPVAYRFAQPGYPELVLFWWPATPGQLRIFTIRNAAGQEKVEYVFSPPKEPRRPFSGMFYHVIPLPEGFNATDVEVETYVFEARETIKIQ